MKTTSSIAGTLCFLLLFCANSFAQPGLGISYTETYSVAAAGALAAPVTPFTNVDDSVTKTIAFTTPFVFGGVSYSSFYISTNGWIGLSNLAAGSVPPLGIGAVGSLPDNNGVGLSNSPSAVVWPGPIIAPLWDNLLPGTVTYKLTATSLQVAWNNVKWDHLNAGAVYTTQVQVKLFCPGGLTPGRIQFYYHAPYGTYQNNATGGASVGIADCSGDFYSDPGTAWAAAGAGTASKSAETKTIAPPLPGTNVSIIFDPSTPANDQCAGAVPLIVGTTCVPTSGKCIQATNTGSPAAWCNVAITDNTDVWYKVVKPLGMSAFTLSTDFAVASCRPVTTSMEIYPAGSSCGSLPAAMACTSTGGSINANNAVLNLTGLNACSQDTFLLRIAGDGSTQGNFQVCAQSASNTGATCANATPVCIPLPYTASGLNTNGYGNDYSINVLCLSEYMTGQDYLFSYTAPSNQCVDISIDGTGILSYPGLFVYDGCPNDTLGSSCVASATAFSNGDTIQNITLSSGHTYYIMVDNDSVLSGVNHIPFNFHMYASASAAPANDACGSAIALNGGSPIPSNATCASTLSAAYTTECSNPSPVAGYQNPNCGGFNPILDNDVWFTFTTSFSGLLTINASPGTVNPLVNGGMAVYSGTCGTFGPATLLGCSADSLPDPFMPTLTITVTNATVYHIRFWSSSGFAAGTFHLCFQTNCSPINDLPANAILLSLATPIQGDNTCATGIGEMTSPLNCKDDASSNTVWYSVLVPASGQVAVRISQQTLLDAAVAAFLFPSGPSNAATSYTRLTCNDDIINAPPCPTCGLNGGNDAAIQITQPAGITVYIGVGSSFGTGSFWITVIDGTLGSTFPPLYKKDCGNPVIVCGNSNYYISNGGIGSDGNVCDFTNLACSGGSTTSEVGSTWLQFTVAGASSLGFTITPNDTASPVSNYNYYLWDITSVPNICSVLSSTTPVSCNTVTNTGKTGMRSPPGGAYSDIISPPGIPHTYMLYIENLTSANDDEGALGTNTGFVLDWGIYIGGVYSGITQLSSVSTLSNWIGGTPIDTSFINQANWTGPGTCPAQIPSCSTDANISAATNICVVSSAVSVQNLTINVGGTLKLNPGANLQICGNFTNNGTITADPGSTITFSGSGNQVISGSSATAFTGTNALGNVIINKTTGTVVTNNNLDLQGSFTTSNNTSIFNVNGKYMRVGGNFTNNNGTTTFAGLAGSTVEFFGSGANTFQNVNGSADTLNRVVMNKTGSITLSGANSSLRIDSALILTNGKIITTSLPSLEVSILNNGQFATALSGGNTNSFIQGKLRRKIYSGVALPNPFSLDFPLGDAVKGYELANITVKSSTLITNLLGYFNSWPSSTPASGPNVSECSGNYYSSLPIFDNGYWTFLRPTSSPFNGLYEITLKNNNYTNSAGSAAWSVAKCDTGIANIS